MRRFVAVISLFIALCLVFICIKTNYRGGEKNESAVLENVDIKRNADEPKKVVPKKASPNKVAPKKVAPKNEIIEDEIAEADEKPSASSESSDIEKDVDYFDSLTDKWMDDSKAKVSIKDVEHFVRALKRIAKERQAECVQRALNLIPDENVMLLAGILADKSIDKEIVESVFNDILNRNEDVKKPILEFIFKDKSHPCWADAAWILDVTGQLPKEKK